MHGIFFFLFFLSTLVLSKYMKPQTGKSAKLFRTVCVCACAQLYRLERYTECEAVYKDLIRNSQDEYEEERKTNLAAVQAARSTWEKATPVSQNKCSLESTTTHTQHIT